ncbi:hypothetical protein AVEN_153304-1 [Araneus ventricosus]|uniref:C2H2-type domain-containing protein n=1 Tax=Araneus ventricosus TaxID=182803 RepID=A0A4Y2IE92_ARAVE|nr:hypothetical protein AVEN_153304-1 [Araneus ventricosus]
MTITNRGPTPPIGDTHYHQQRQAPTNIVPTWEARSCLLIWRLLIAPRWDQGGYSNPHDWAGLIYHSYLHIGHQFLKDFSNVNSILSFESNISIRKCPYCPYSSPSGGNVKTHMAVHTGERPYVCHVCKKSFTQKGNLKTHMRLHSGERPFKCHLCSRDFVQHQHLKDHLLKHEKSLEYMK